MSTFDNVAGEDILPEARTYYRLRDTLMPRLDALEALMTSTRDEFDAGLAEIGTAIGEQSSAVNELADRIAALPDNDVTAADVASLKSLADAARGTTDRVRTLAVQSTAIPTDETPADGGTDV